MLSSRTTLMPSAFDEVTHTCICIETDSGVKALAMFQNIQSECDFSRFPHLLYSQQSAFQVQPEGYFLHGSARRWVAIQLGDLESSMQFEI